MKVNYKSQDYNLPDFLVVGGAKCGTTSLFYYLEQHPEIFAPSEKEPHFFSFVDNDPQFVSPANLLVTTDVMDYANLFQGANDSQLLCEASTSYLYDYETTIKNIKNIYGESYKDLKIIILLRNPVDRAWSQYWQFKKFNHEPLSFEESIKEKTVSDRLNNNWNYYYDYLGFGKYYEQVKAYVDTFKNVKVFFQEDFLLNSNATLKETISFLGIDNDFHIETERKYNPSGGTKRNLYGFIWTLKTKTKIFVLLKQIVPLKIRKKIIYFFMDKALVRKEINENLRDDLILKFKQENLKLYEFLKKDDINFWN